jgi:hypothetical protein
MSDFECSMSNNLIPVPNSPNPSQHLRATAKYETSENPSVPG